MNVTAIDPATIALLDCEASGLGRDSYPIEIAWGFVDAARFGEIKSHLVRPLPFWSDWDPEAEKLHGISRASLLREGEPAEAVARRVASALRGLTVYTDAPAFDGRWLRRLMQDTGVSAVFRIAPFQALLLDVSDGHFASSGPRDAMIQARRQVAWLKAIAERADRTHPCTHRAAADVRHHLEVLRLALAGPDGA